MIDFHSFWSEILLFRSDFYSFWSEISLLWNEFHSFSSKWNGVSLNFVHSFTFREYFT